MQILINPFVSIDYDKNYDCVTITWRKFTPSQVLRESYQKAAAFKGTKRPKFWLVDKTHIKVISPEDQLWLANHWIPKLGDEIKMAFIDSADMFGKLSIRNVVKNVNEKYSLQLEIFNETKEAEAWLPGN